jgi:transcription elongation GreA/GreB family factor
MKATVPIVPRYFYRHWKSIDHSPLHKPHLIQHLQSLLQSRIEEAQAAIASTYAARNDDTKSSAGDKHEVGRAMIQQELDKQEAQLAKLQASQQELARIPLDRRFDRAAFGSLVNTDAGDYLIAIGLGPVKIDGATVFVVSLASPIGQLLKDRQAGDKVVFNGKEITIKAIDP